MSRKNWAMIYHLGFGYPYYYPVLYTGTFTTSSATVPADTGAGAIYGNNYFDGCILMPLSGVCAYQPRKILSFATTTGIFTMNNPFNAAPGTVQYMILIDANEYNRADTAATGAVTTTDTIMAYIKQLVTNTYRLDETACADITDPVDMTTEIVDNSILANVLTDNGDTSVYDRRIHSLEALYNALIGSVDTANRAVGKTQIKSTTIDLHQAAGAKDLFTGTTQDVLIKSLTFRLPDIDVSDDAAITGISIQTDDTTPQVFINLVVGAKAYLTAEAQLSWTGSSLLKSGNKVQLTIIGGTATAEPTTCDVVCEFEAVVSGGYLA